MHLNGIDFKEDYPLIEAILLDMGSYYSLHDDYMDCFGSPKETGKVGTDLEDGKCCWPIVTALELCNKKQRQTLIDNYGDRSQKSVSAIRQIYEEVELINVFKIHEDSLYGKISEVIGRLQSEGKPYASTLKWWLQVLVNRNR